MRQPHKHVFGKPALGLQVALIGPWPAAQGVRKHLTNQFNYYDLHMIKTQEEFATTLHRVPFQSGHASQHHLAMDAPG